MPRKAAFAAIVLLLIATNVLAAPSISGVSGTWTHGSSVTVSGSAFTTKASQTPWLWDNFDNGAVGQNWQDRGWTNYARWSDCCSYKNDAYVDNVRAWSGSNSVSHYMGAADDFNGWFPNDTIGSHDVYVSYMCYHDDTAAHISPYGVVKYMRMRSGTDPYSGSPLGVESPSLVVQYHPNGETNPNTYTFYANGTPDCWLAADGTGCTTGEDSSEQNLQPRGQWNRFEAWVKHSSPAGTANGTARSWYNRVLDFSRTNAITLTASHPTATEDHIIIPMMQADDGTPPPQRWTWWVDDVYIDANGPARVEICNANTWAGSTSCTVQPYTAWSDTSATITVNRGQFGATDNAWLYVIDGTNTVSSSRAITFGDSGTPSVPVLLTPIDNATAGWPVVFTWSAIDSSDAGYELQVDDNSNYSSPEIDAVIECENYVCDDDDRRYEADQDELAAKTHYYWRVRALR